MNYCPFHPVTDALEYVWWMENQLDLHTDGIEVGAKKKQLNAMGRNFKCFFFLSYTLKIRPDYLGQQF